MRVFVTSLIRVEKSAAQDAYKDTDFKKNSGADIEIHYIHGRLSRDSSRIEGDLILSEESYAQCKLYRKNNFGPV